MARKVSEKAVVAYVHEQPREDWPGEIDWQGPGYYVVETDDENDHTQASFGRKVDFQLNTPNEEGQPPNPENNEGHWVYADTDNTDEEEEA